MLHFDTLNLTPKRKVENEDEKFVDLQDKLHIQSITR